MGGREIRGVETVPAAPARAEAQRPKRLAGGSARERRVRHRVVLEEGGAGLVGPPRHVVPPWWPRRVPPSGEHERTMLAGLKVAELRSLLEGAGLAVATKITKAELLRQVEAAAAAGSPSLEADADAAAGSVRRDFITRDQLLGLGTQGLLFQPQGFHT